MGLEIKTKGSTRVENVWPSITGVNVLAPGYHVLSNFSSSGFPDESCLDMEVEWISNLATPNSTLSLPIPVDSRPIWYKTTFDALHDGLTFSMPLRLHVNGPGTAYIWLNDTIIARYYGTDGPQHDFYLMSGLLKTDEVNEIKMVVYNGRVDDGEDQGGILTVQIKGWNVTLNGPAEDRWSGNLDDNNNILLERILE